MFKHIIFFLYLLSYTSGIGAITLGLFLYHYKLKSKTLKYFIYADLFLTATLSLNTLNFYQKLIHFADENSFLVFLVYGLLFSSFFKLLFHSLTINQLLGEEFSTPMKLAHSIGVLLALAGLFMLHILAVHEVINVGIAAHTGCLISTLVSTLGTLYNALRALKRLDKITTELKLLVQLLSVFGLATALLALFFDLSGYIVYHNFPIAFSPISYFTLNIIVLTLAAKYYCGQPATVTVSVTSPATPADYQTFCQAYEITARELEIILLIAKGNSNQEIGDELYISLHTVRNHIYNIFKKVGVKKRRELINKLNGIEE